jgi:hypothetical protein
MRYWLTILVLTVFALSSNAQNYVWAKGEGGIGNDAAYSVTSDEAGNTYVTGNLAGVADFSGVTAQGKGVYEIFIAKYSPTGNLIWVKTAGGKGNDVGYAIQYQNGYLYLAGKFEDTAYFENTTLISHGDGDAFVAKYDNNGNLIWVTGGGGQRLDYVSGLTLDDNGSIYVSGTYQASATFSGTQITTSNLFGESFVASYNNNGALQWVKSATGTAFNLLKGITYDNNGGLFITGYFGGGFSIDSISILSNTPSYDIVLGKLTTNGDVVWLTHAGSIAEDAGQSVCADKDGNAFVTGYFTRTAYFDADSIQYLDYNDVFIAKYDANGHYQWVIPGYGTQLDIGYAIATDNEGNIYTGGMFENAINFSGHTVSGIDRDVFIVSYTNNGNFRWLDKANGVLTSAALGIHVKQNNNIAICGYYLHDLMFGSIPIDYSTYNDLFAAEYHQPLVSGINRIEENSLISVYPNPMGEVCNLKLNTGSSAQIMLTDISGKLISSTTFNGNYQLNTAALATGVYLLQVDVAGEKQVLKLVK